MSPRRRAFWIVAFLCSVGIGTAIHLAPGAADESMARDLVRPRNRNYEAPNPPEEVDHVFRVEVGPPAATLDVWVFAPEGEPQSAPIASLIILHGIGDAKATMKGVGKRYSRLGITTILVDLRGHGASSPSDLGWGVFEAPDLVQVVDFLETRGHAPSPIGVYGPSYGGAVALQFAARDPRVARVVTVGAFVTMHRQVAAYRGSAAEENSFLRGLWRGPVAARAGEIAGFDSTMAAPLRHIAQIQGQVILVHAETDEIVPFVQAQDLARACGPRCRLVPLTGYRHLESLSNRELRAEMMTAFTE